MQTAGTDPARRRALAAAALLALGLHAALLGSLADGAARPGPPPAGAVQVRTIVPAAPVAPVAPAVIAAPAPVAAAAAAPTAVKREPPPAAAADLPAAAAAADLPAAGPAMAATSAAVEAPAVAEVPASSPPVVALAEAAAAASAPAAPASAPEAAAAGGEPPPLYRTRLPPAATLHYELQRGRLAGSGELRWWPQADRYELSLQGSVVGLRVLTQLSQGGLDEHGLVPERFTDQRLRRPMQAANFRRDSGRISFSGPPQELPLWPGVQDRLSWMVQLAAVVAGEPARWVAGERIVLQVVGARGDAGPWVFQVFDGESVETPSGPVQALRLRREPRGPFDTTVEVWLDPARHHLPVRATLRSGEDDRLELRLRELLPGP